MNPGYFLNGAVHTFFFFFFNISQPRVVARPRWVLYEGSPMLSERNDPSDLTSRCLWPLSKSYASVGSQRPWTFMPVCPGKETGTFREITTELVGLFALLLSPKEPPCSDYTPKVCLLHIMYCLCHGLVAGDSVDHKGSHVDVVVLINC